MLFLNLVNSLKLNCQKEGGISNKNKKPLQISENIILFLNKQVFPAKQESVMKFNFFIHAFLENNQKKLEDIPIFVNLLGQIMGIKIEIISYINPEFKEIGQTFFYCISHNFFIGHFHSYDFLPQITSNIMKNNIMNFFYLSKFLNIYQNNLSQHTFAGIKFFNNRYGLGIVNSKSLDMFLGFVFWMQNKNFSILNFFRHDRDKEKNKIFVNNIYFLLFNFLFFGLNELTLNEEEEKNQSLSLFERVSNSIVISISLITILNLIFSKSNLIFNIYLVFSKNNTFEIIIKIGVFRLTIQYQNGWSFKIAYLVSFNVMNHFKNESITNHLN